MSIALQSWLLIAWGSQPTPFSPARLPKLLISRPLPPGVSVEQAIANYGSFALPGGLQLPVHDLIIIVVFGAVAGALWWFFSSTMIADAIVAAADSPLGARACGIPVHRVVGVAFFLGGGIASLGGSLYVLRMKSLEPHAGFSIGIIAFAACVLGGIGSLRGSVIGALLAGMVMSLAPAVPLGKWLREYLPSSWMPWLPSLNLADWSYGVVYCLMIVVILFRPRGLFAR
jgi:branched-chain amino acid transport system permease protein